jgi:nicotinamide phosphoribosyltransferase
MYSYLESRGGRYSHTVFFGLQMLLKLDGFDRPVTKEQVEEATAFAVAHGLPFNMNGWMRIVEKFGGYLPIKIKAVPEGTVVPVHNILMSCESTDPETFWVVSYVETMLMRIWYPITVCTQSWHIRRMILDYLRKTSDNPEGEINFKLHDFGSRGVSSRESAMLGGAAHIVNFMGSDTVAGVWAANKFYQHKMAAFSIPAMEHSTVTSWGREHEADAYDNMLKLYAKPGALIACVSDSYDIYNAVSEIWGGKLRQKVIDSGAIVVVRPDSGTPYEVVLSCLKLLEEKFGATRTRTGNYKVLNNVRVIQGDGINEDSIREILETATRAGYSASNIAFGMGGALLQRVNRDTQKMAYKCSEITVGDHDVPVFKDPITDPGKRSKSGRLNLVVRNGLFETTTSESFGNVMKTVFEDGKFVTEWSLDQVRAAALADG